METKYWKLNDKEPIIRTYHSGPVKDYTIRIIWSDKLGLCFKTTFNNYNVAEKQYEYIKSKDYIDIDQWHKVYYPGKRFTEIYAD